ncbi:MAG: poly-beta-hydroxybutyrate polymerase, partial [Burkholderiaceae bacterium]
PVALSDIRQPMFVVGTEKDHVAPWKSVYKIHRLVDGEITFALTNGGHNAGIVSEPGHANRHYAVRTRPPGGAWVDAEHWAPGAERREGSWWQGWHDWLLAHGSGRRVKARHPPRDAALGDAPGSYVHQRYDDPPL